MKCLEKDRARRYETANGLAMDIKRHLIHEPVVARPPSTAYRFQKAFRRNKLVFAAAGAIAAALLLGASVSVWQATRATRAQGVADAARQKESHLREQAVAARADAEKARANEAQLRQQAQAQELAARRRAYASDMNLVQQSLQMNNVGRALGLLNQHRPVPGYEDLRGWEWRYLWQFCRSDALYTLGSLNEPERSLAASSDGRWLAVVGLFTERCRIWDLRTRSEVEGVASNLVARRVAFCPKQALLAVAGVQGSGNSARPQIQLWDVSSRQLVRSLSLDEPPGQLAVSADGKTLVAATISQPPQIVLWRIEDGAILSRFDAPGFESFVFEEVIAISTDGNLVAYVVTPDRIRVVDAATGSEKWSASGAEDMVTTLTFSPDGQLLASGAGYAESDIRLWNVGSGKQVGRLEGHRGWVPALAFGPDSKTLASASADQTIRLWDVVSQQSVGLLRGHQHEVWRIALLPDKVTLISGSKDGVLAVWDASVNRQQRQFVTLPKPVDEWRFSPDSRSIVAVDHDGGVARWHGPDFREEEHLLEISQNRVSSAISLDNRFVAVGEGDDTIKVWELQTRKLVHELRVPHESYGRKFIANGKQLLTVESKPEGEIVAVWDLATGVPSKYWTNSGESILIAATDDGRWALSLRRDHSCAVREISTGRERTGSLRFDIIISDVRFSPDGKIFAFATEPGVARFWDASNFQEIGTVKGHILSVHSIGFASDMKRFATGSLGKEAIKVWDLESKLELITLEGQSARLNRTEFSPDGNILASINTRGVLHLWRAPSWAEIEVAEKAERKTP
jgi:WD40 repeat protein